MEHPLIDSLDSLTEDQLLEKISELNKKLMIAYGTGNSWLCEQIRMALESYTVKYREKLNNRGKGDNNFDDIIDVK
jgi:hypothetical protein